MKTKLLKKLRTIGRNQIDIYSVTRTLTFRGECITGMTPKQKAELARLVRDEEHPFRIALVESDFYNKNHIDYRGLLERGLAIDCSRLKIY